jgi:tetratricopeptide (TPR) repeat protein
MLKNLLLSAVCCLALASTAPADIVATHTVINTGDVVRVDADGVEINLPIGQITVPKSDIVSIQIDQPATFQAGLDALKAQRFQEAVNDLKPLVDRYAGLSLPWVQQSLLRVGDAYLGLKDFASAKQAFDAFKTQYPDSTDAQGLDVKYAKVLLEEKEYAKAADALQAFLGPLMKRDFLTDDQEVAAAEAYTLLGDCQAAMNKPEDALDNYLKVVTLFNMDPDRAAEAKYKAATVFEQLGNWKRAKGSYEEVLRDSPSFAFAADAQQRLAALTKAHPE